MCSTFGRRPVACSAAAEGSPPSPVSASSNSLLKAACRSAMLRRCSLSNSDSSGLLGRPRLTWRGTKSDISRPVRAPDALRAGYSFPSDGDKKAADKAQGKLFWLFWTFFWEQPQQQQLFFKLKVTSEKGFYVIVASKPFCRQKRLENRSCTKKQCCQKKKSSNPPP